MRNEIYRYFKFIKITMCLLVAVGFAIGIGTTRAANEYSITAILRVDNGNFSQNRSVQNYLKDQDGTALDSGITTSQTSSTQTLQLVNVTAPGGYMFVRNLGSSTSNSIQIVLTLQLGPGDVAVFPVGTTNIQHFTTNGPASLEYWINAK